MPAKVMPAVSVAVGTFNGERYLREQLGSILAQTLPPAEVVIADDGSSDGTLGIVAEIAGRSAVPIRVLPAAGRLGVTANFARAMAATSGDVVALADQDDRWHPDRLERLVPAFADDPQLLLLHHDADLVDAAGAPLGHTLFESLYISPAERAAIRDDRAFEVFIRRNLVTGATTLVRRSLIERAAPFPAAWVHDEWLAAIAAATGRVRTSDERLVDYRQHGANAIGVNQPTLSYRLRRMVAPRNDRYVALAAHAAVLAERLRGMDGVDPRWADLADRKAAFERYRAAYPRNRLARLPRVLARSGSYPALSSQGRLDVLRDTLQPAGDLRR